MCEHRGHLLGSSVDCVEVTGVVETLERIRMQPAPSSISKNVQNIHNVN